MTIDVQTGEVAWTPSETDDDLVPVTLAVFDPRGAAGLLSYTIRVGGGNRAPEFVGLPDEILIREGEPLALTVSISDPDEDDVLTVWADNIPPGATFDAESRTLSWVPGFASAGTYEFDLFTNDGARTSSTTVRIAVRDGLEPLELIPPVDRTLREGDRIRFNVRASGGTNTIQYSANGLPSGAFLDPHTGLFDGRPSLRKQEPTPSSLL